MDDDLFDGVSAPSDTGLFAGISPAGSNLFEGIDTPQETQLSTAIGRKQADVANIQENIAKLQAIKPANAEHAARIQEAIKRLQGSLDGSFVYGNEENRGTIDNLARGITAGVSKGLLLGGADLAMLPFKALGIADYVPGFKAFEGQVEEAKQNIQEVTDPEGVAGTVGDFAGTIAGSAPAYGAAAELTGQKIVARFPGSRIAKAIEGATEAGASRLTRATANVATGAPINIAQGLASGNQEVTPDMSPEERQAVEQQNRADKIKNVGIGILADALFGFALPGRKTPEGKTTPPELPPDRQAQFDALKKKADAQVAERNKRNERRKSARSEWAQQNPGQSWKDLPKEARTKVYSEFDIRADAKEVADAVGFLGDEQAPAATPANSNLNQELADAKKQIVELNNRLKQEETRRNDVERQAEQDPLMGIGNGRALTKAMNRVDTDPSTVWLFFDSNGLKAINDTFGHESGDKLLLGNRDALIRSLKEHGIEVDPQHAGNIFRPSEGGDELVAAVPRDKAQSILEKAEEYSNQQFDNVTGNMSGAIYDTYAEGQSIDGNSRLQSRKIVSKVKYGIPARNAEEQELMDAVKKALSEHMAGGSEAQVQAAAPRVQGLEPTSRFAPPSEGVAPVEGAQSNAPIAKESARTPEEETVNQLIDSSKERPVEKTVGDSGESIFQTEDLPDFLGIAYERKGKWIAGVSDFKEHPQIFSFDSKKEAEDFIQGVVKQKRSGADIVNFSTMDENEINFRRDKLRDALEEARINTGKYTKEQVDAFKRDLKMIEEETAHRASQEDKKAIEDLLSSVSKEPSAADTPSPATPEPASAKISPDQPPQEPTLETPPSTAGTRHGEMAELYRKLAADVRDAEVFDDWYKQMKDDGMSDEDILGSLKEQVAELGPEIDPSQDPLMQASELGVKALQEKGLSLEEARRESARGIKAELDRGTSPEEILERTKAEVADLNGDSSGVDKFVEQDLLAKETFLESQKHKKPLEKMSERELDRLDDKVMNAIQKADPKSDEYKILQRDLDRLMDNQRRLNEEAKAGKQTAPEKAPDYSGPERATTPAAAVEESKRLLGEHARTLMKKSLRTMNIEDLKLHIDDLQSRVNALTVIEGKPYRERLDKALAEIAERRKGDQGQVARIPPGVGGAGLGFALGYMKNPGDDEDRMTNALEWALVGAAAGTVAGRMVKRGTAPRLTVPADRLPRELPGGEWQAEARKTIVHNPEKGRKPIPFLEQMRKIYNGIARNTYTAERFQQSLGASKLPTEYNAAKQFGMFGRYTGQTESALRYGPAIYDEYGNAQKLDAKGIGEILDMVDGDAESLGDLMAALTTMEQAGLVKNPMPLHVAERTFHAMPEMFHKAAAEARKFSLAMAQVGVDGGLLSPEIVARFVSENFYAPMIRIFGLTAEKLTKAEPEKVIAGAASPFKARTGGSSKAVLSPFESMVNMIPRIYRAAELNKIKNLWIDAWEAAQKPEHLMSRISKDQIKLSGTHEARIKAIQNELAISRGDAERMVAALEPTMIDPLSGTMRVYRNGNLESYRVPKDLAQAMVNLAPDDMHLIVKMLGLPSRTAVKGITMHPFFVAKMAFFDMWQATLNSQYGFRFGIDNIRGFLHAAADSKSYRNFLASGGQHQALYGPSKSNFSTSISDIKARKGSPLGVAFRQIRQVKPIEAWKTLVTPISDAARVGEYLRAKDHGASDIEAVYAAKVVTANYNEVGSWGAMRALQHMTMFLGPAIQVMDQATYRAGIHPFRRPEEGRLAAATQYGLKALTTIALPSFVLWFANKDDEEINDLRKTQFGTKYWFTRTPSGTIVKIPKPPVDGQIFGTTLEGVLDKYNEGDPHGMDRISGSVLRDAAFNILPTFGVIPYSLESNTNLGLGFPIVPEGDRDLALQYQGADKASWLAREVSQHVAPLAENASSQAIRTGATPAGIDFLINSLTGMIGQDVSLGVSQAIEQESTGYVPAKEEYPVIKRVLVKVPTENVASVQRFYDTAEKVQTAGSTVDYLVRHDPDKVMGYAESKQFELAVLPTYAKVRQQIANYHRTIIDVKNAPASAISPADKRIYIDQLTTQIVKLARMVNDYTQKAEAQYKQ